MRKTNKDLILSEPTTRREFLARTVLGAAGAVFVSQIPATAATMPLGDEFVKPIHRLTPKPPLGWNSWDSYGSHIDQAEVLVNLDAFAKRLKPAGYDFFVVDMGWYSEYELVPGTKNPKKKKHTDNQIDEYGRYLPSKTYFSGGIKPIADKAHQLGVKFGLHTMRGIPRQAVALNTPILGTKYRAQDIANVNSICPWSELNYGIDMTKPGAQEYYDSFYKMLAEWGVDFIKADDITGHPAEIDAVAKAIEKTGRPIVLSLSPGDETDAKHLPAYLSSNMFRTTRDIWDNRLSLERAFTAWHFWSEQPHSRGFYPDLDMIPFGHLLVKFGVSVAGGEQSVSLGRPGTERMSKLTDDQKYTFITMRALAASPLFMGGDLPTSDEFSFRLITDAEMLRCNQNGVQGKRIYATDNIEVWHTPERGKSANGWLGIFNRNTDAKKIELTSAQLGLNKLKNLKVRDVWKDKSMKIAVSMPFEIGADGVIFLRYEGKK